MPRLFAFGWGLSTSEILLPYFYSLPINYGRYLSLLFIIFFGEGFIVSGILFSTNAYDRINLLSFTLYILGEFSIPLDIISLFCMHTFTLFY